MRMLVTGGTGRQGGAAVRAAQRAGVEVRALVRDQQAPLARALADRGVELVRGNLNDPESLRVACAGVDAVFSVQQRPTSRGGYGLRGGGRAASEGAASAAGDLDPDAEFLQARNLIDAALAAGVRHLIQATAVMPRREASISPPRSAKLKAEAYLRGAGLAAWTVLRPGFFMENLPTYLLGDRMVTGFFPDTRFGLIAADDIGTAAVSAALNPERFDGATVNLVGDIRTFAEIGIILSAAWDRKIDASPLSDDEAVALGLPPDIVRIHRQMAAAVPQADPSEMHALGLPITPLEVWAAAHQPDVS